MKMLLCAVAAITIGAIDNCSAHDGSACVKINKIVDDSYLTIRADNRCGSDIILRWTEKREDGRVDTGGMTIDKCKDDSYVYQTGPRSTVDIYEYVTINPTALDCDKKLRPRHADPLGDTASQIKSRLGPAEARANQAAAQENDYFKDAYKRIEIEYERNARKAQQEAAAESARQSEDAAWKAFAATAHGTKNNCSEIDDPNCVIDFDASDFPQLRGKCRKSSAALRATGRIFHFTACLH